MARALSLSIAGICLATLGCSGGSDDAPGAAPPPTSADVGALPPKTAALVEAPDPRFFADRQGRALILRGANMVGSKSGPDYIGAVTDAEIAKLRSYGMNVARQLIYWAGLEPTAGRYDEAYLDAIGKRLDAYAAHGVYVVLDMHQDIYAEAVGGDGAPTWAVFTDGKSVTPPGAGPWYLAATSPGVQAAYRNFWDPERGHPELQQHYIANWAHVAARFKGHPAVIGYDVMNEPVFSNGDLAATIAFHDAATKSGDWRNSKLIDFTQRVVDAIRAVDPDGYVLYEPTSLLNSNLGGALGGPFPGDVTGITDPRKGPPRLGYAPHLYDLKVEQGGGWTTTNTYVKDWETVRAKDRETQGGTLFLGEFGGSCTQTNMDAYVAEVLRMADRQMMGYALWAFGSGSWSPRGADGQDTAWATWLVRPYPRAVAGVPTSFSYDAEKRVFRLAFTSRADAYGPTEIALPASRVYPSGYEVVVGGDPGAAAAATTRYAADLEILAVTTDPAIARYTLCVAKTAADCTD